MRQPAMRSGQHALDRTVDVVEDFLRGHCDFVDIAPRKPFTPSIVTLGIAGSAFDRDREPGPQAIKVVDVVAGRIVPAKAQAARLAAQLGPEERAQQQVVPAQRKHRSSDRITAARHVSFQADP